jgi:hypothetical protein
MGRARLLCHLLQTSTSSAMLTAYDGRRCSTRLHQTRCASTSTRHLGAARIAIIGSSSIRRVRRRQSRHTGSDWNESNRHCHWHSREDTRNGRRLSQFGADPTICRNRHAGCRYGSRRTHLASESSIPKPLRGLLRLRSRHPRSDDRTRTLPVPELPLGRTRPGRQRLKERLLNSNLGANHSDVSRLVDIG